MEKEIAKVVRSGEFQLGNMVLKCHVLDNGQRVIEEESMRAFLADGTAFTEEQAVEALTKLKNL